MDIIVIYKRIQPILKLILFILIVALIVETFGYKGIIGFLILSSLFGLYKLWIYRSNFLETIRTIETIIWGKPLEKEYWNKNELKNTKVKIKWKRKKN